MIKKKIKLTALLLGAFLSTFAGNKDRSGQAGATELLLNPYGRSSGMFGLNGSFVTGAEALKLNMAGIASTVGTEVSLAHTRYLSGTGMNMSNLGVTHNLNGDNVIGVNVMSFGFGEIPITQEGSVGSDIGTYKPTFINMTLGLGHKFSDNMTAGIGFTYVNEAISNIKASAMAFDGGVQYTNGKRDNLHIGIALRNVGSNLRFSGDGFSFLGLSPDQAKDITVQSRTEKAPLPSQLNLATSYDFYLDEKKTMAKDKDARPSHRLSPMFSFISNSFSSDWLGLAAEYAYKEKFMLRAGYRYESKIFDKDEVATLYSGVAVGVSFVTKVSSSKTGPGLAIDYGFKPTRFSAGVHTVGIRLNLSGKE
ncbi:MAG: PorV/PorQ family protein [Chitinophagaceae bacterium]|nr:PorV/PorQ family protein [Chitinophagaceae bacterium]